MNLTSNNTIELSLSSYLELDSHADTSCAGSNCRVLEYTNKTCTVSSFSSKQTKVHDVPIVTVATAYDALNGEIYILIMNQSLYLGGAYATFTPVSKPSKISWSNRRRCSTTPITRWKQINTFYYLHRRNISIPLEINGCISHLSTQYPTSEEVKNCQWLTLTSPTEWDPYYPMFSENE
jgi:hypothetical protein